MENASPIPGVDYPRTFDEMDDWFRTDAQCRDYKIMVEGGFAPEKVRIMYEPFRIHGIAVCRK